MTVRDPPPGSGPTTRTCPGAPRQAQLGLLRLLKRAARFSGAPRGKGRQRRAGEGTRRRGSAEPPGRPPGAHSAGAGRRSPGGAVPAAPGATSRACRGAAAAAPVGAAVTGPRARSPGNTPRSSIPAFKETACCRTAQKWNRSVEGSFSCALALCSVKNKGTARKPSLNRTKIEPFSLNNTLFWHVCLFTSKLFVKCMVEFDLREVETSYLNCRSLLQESNIVSDESLVG